MSDQLSLEKTLVQDLLRDRRAARRWKNIRFFIWIALSLLIVFSVMRSHHERNHHHEKNGYVSLIRLSGEIGANHTFSARNVIPMLTKAFKNKDSKGVVLFINSPGGSPVQASLIREKILQLRQKYHKKVMVYGEDTLASGAYLVATAANQIIVNPDTITGSIGVIYSGFGFTQAITKLGITRRVITAGDHKDGMDSFQPLQPATKEKLRAVVKTIHQHFIQAVIESRGKKLHGKHAVLFSGGFWTGSQAVKLGLADAATTPWAAMQTMFGTTHYRDYTPTPSFFADIMQNFSTDLSSQLLSHAHVSAIL